MWPSSPIGCLERPTDGTNGGGGVEVEIHSEPRERPSIAPVATEKQQECRAAALEIWASSRQRGGGVGVWGGDGDATPQRQRAQKKSAKERRRGDRRHKGQTVGSGGTRSEGRWGGRAQHHTRVGGPEGCYSACGEAQTKKKREKEREERRRGKERRKEKEKKQEKWNSCVDSVQQQSPLLK